MYAINKSVRWKDENLWDKLRINWNFKKKIKEITKNVKTHIKKLKQKKVEVEKNVEIKNKIWKGNKTIENQKEKKKPKDKNINKKPLILIEEALLLLAANKQDPPFNFQK